MADTCLFTILHISDFHYANRRVREQRPVVDALIADLKTICVGHRKPDLVMFTGDLVHAAGTDGHDDAYDFLLDRVSKATGCSDERIFIAPGNHDLSWTGLQKFADETRSWRALLGTDEETDRFNEFHEAKAFDAAVAEKFSNYLDLERYLSAGSRQGARRLSNAFVTVDHVDPLNVDVVTFNTAVLSTGGHKAHNPDERNLVVPEYAVMDAVRALTPGSLRIFVTHHPLPHLSERSGRYLEAEIAKHAHVHLFGHMHDPQPRSISGLRGNVLTDQAGAIFTQRKTYYNGYALITLDRQNGHSETLLRSYFADRDEFDEGTDVIKDGVWWPTQEAREHFRKIATPVDQTAFREHLAGPALTALVEREQGSEGDADTHERFVAPPLRRSFIQENDSDETKVQAETQIPFQDVVDGDTNLILYARAEYGRTTLLKELRYRLLNEAHSLRFPRLPVLIDFSDVGSNVDNMLRKAKGGCEATPEGNDLESLLKLGHACVMIDDVIFTDGRRMRILREFVERYPKARYVFDPAIWWYY